MVRDAVVAVAALAGISSCASEALAVVALGMGVVAYSYSMKSRISSAIDMRLLVARLVVLWAMQVLQEIRARAVCSFFFSSSSSSSFFFAASYSSSSLFFAANCSSSLRFSSSFTLTSSNILGGFACSSLRSGTCLISIARSWRARW